MGEGRARLLVSANGIYNALWEPVVTVKKGGHTHKEEKVRQRVENERTTKVNWF